MQSHVITNANDVTHSRSRMRNQSQRKMSSKQSVAHFKANDRATSLCHVGNKINSQRSDVNKTTCLASSMGSSEANIAYSVDKIVDQI